MTPQEMLNKYACTLIPRSEIYSDDNFNCRGEISVTSVAELARDIQQRGLDYPITVQPAEDVKKGLPPGFKYRIVAGHRRFIATRVIGWMEVPCMVKRGMDEIQARVTNLGENLKREDLNVLQEARALQGLYEAGVARERVAEMVGKSGGWVQIRYNLLELPADVQEEAAAGMFTQTQIKQLYSLRFDRDALYDAVKRAKTAKQRGEKAPKRLSKRQAVSTNTKKIREGDELQDMVELLAKNTGYGLHTRVLAWAAGNITTAELFDDVRTRSTTGAFSLVNQYRAGELDPDQLAEALDDCAEFRQRTLNLPESF